MLLMIRALSDKNLAYPPVQQQTLLARPLSEKLVQRRRCLREHDCAELAGGLAGAAALAAIASVGGAGRCGCRSRVSIV
jgi:hypothetical protein